MAKEWRNNNKDKVREYNIAHSAEHKKWEEDNREHLCKWRRERDHKNRKKESKRKKIYFRKRISNDELFKCKVDCRNIIYRAVYRTKPYGESTKMFVLLGCPYDVLQKYLLQTWKKRYKKQYSGEKFNIDHIVPLCMAKNEVDVIKLCHYTNLQMLTPEDNRGKSDKIHF